MKTTKLILLCAFCLSIFNSCSKEEPFAMETEEVIALEAAKTSEVQRNDIKSNSSTKAANKTRDWFPDDNEQPSQDTPTSAPTLPYIVEFVPNLTAVEKQNARDRYADYLGILSYEVCSINPDKEIWTLDATIYNDDTLAPPYCPTCSGPGGGTIDKDTHVENDPDFNRATLSHSAHPCKE